MAIKFWELEIYALHARRTTIDIIDVILFIEKYLTENETFSSLANKTCVMSILKKLCNNWSMFGQWAEGVLIEINLLNKIHSYLCSFV